MAHEKFDPYSDKTLEAVRTVEALPFSLAFEHVMYDHFVERRAAYQFQGAKRAETHEDDPHPIHIPANLMMLQFPEQLRDSFPDLEYVISRLEIEQIEKPKAKNAPDQSSFYMHFLANDTPYEISGTGDLFTYETIDASFESVTYSIDRATAIGLLATFVYARQYDFTDPRAQISLAEQSLETERDPLTSLAEQLIMTLGDHAGEAGVTTRSAFPTPDGRTLVAELQEKEFPDKSRIGSHLSLAEVTDINGFTTITSTDLTQNAINIEQGNWILPSGTISSRYAEQTTTVLTELPLSSIQLIDPDLHFDRWAHVCESFEELVRKPLRKYRHLDGTRF